MEQVDIYNRVVEILSEQTDKKPEEFSPEMTFEDLAIDSFDFVELVFLIEDEFDIEVNYNFNDVESKLKSLGDLVEGIESRIAAKSEQVAEPAVA